MLNKPQIKDTCKIRTTTNYQQHYHQQHHPQQLQ